MKKPMIIMLIGVGSLCVLVVGLKTMKNYMIAKHLEAFRAPILTISAAKVSYNAWQPQYQASASMRAVQGVSVTTETAGMVRKIYFTPGAMAKKGQLLVQLDVDAQNAQLKSLQATDNLNKITYNRDKAQYAIKAISKATLDTDLANWQSSTASVNEQIATIAKSTIYAPFDGRLGICQVNIGQYINPGDKITTLETLNPIYADFYVPQSVLPRLKVGQMVNLSSDAFPQQTFTGTLTTIDSSFDSTSRNTEIEATIANPNQTLIPGMFATIVVDTGAEQPHLTLPQAAISFNSYGAIAYRLKPSDKKDPTTGKPIFIANQTFVVTGETRGDQITITSGLAEGDFVVTSGQVKLKNNSTVIVNDAVTPPDNATPTAADKVDKN